MLNNENKEKLNKKNKQKNEGCGPLGQDVQVSFFSHNMFRNKVLKFGKKVLLTTFFER